MIIHTSSYTFPKKNQTWHAKPAGATFCYICNPTISQEKDSDNVQCFFTDAAVRF